MRPVNGDFAIALYDAADRALWLARDRVGSQAAVLRRRADGIAFASQPRALLGVPGVQREPSTAPTSRCRRLALPLLRQRPERSPYAAIAQLPAAHIAAQPAASGSACAAYWELDRAATSWRTEAELAERYRELLLDAVAHPRSPAASRPAFTLSGGMDSSSVIGVRRAALGRAASTPSPRSTPTHDFDETDEIRSMLDAAVERVAPGRGRRVPTCSTSSPRWSRVHDEPVATATWLSHCLLCEQVARRRLRVAVRRPRRRRAQRRRVRVLLLPLRRPARAGRDERAAHEVERWATPPRPPGVPQGPRRGATRAGAAASIRSRPGAACPTAPGIERYAGALGAGLLRPARVRAGDGPARSAAI